MHRKKAYNPVLHEQVIFPQFSGSNMAQDIHHEIIDIRRQPVFRRQINVFLGKWIYHTNGMPFNENKTYETLLKSVCKMWLALYE